MQQQETSTLFEIRTVNEQEKEDLSSYVLCWDQEVVNGISSRDFDRICKQIISLKLPEETLLKFLMKNDDLMIDYNNELGSKIHMKSNKPERWIEMAENDGQLNSDKMTASNFGTDKVHSIEISWPHFVKYIQSVKIGSEVRFYIYKENPFLMLEVMLSDTKNGARVEYGSLRLIIKQGVHELPTVGKNAFQMLYLF